MNPQVGDRLFVYGTLLPGAKNYRILEGKTELLGEARLEDAALYNLGWFPGLKYKVGHTVLGQLLTITNEKLPRELDSYEGYPRLYDRQKVKTSGGEAWVYIFNDEVSDEQIIPGGDWLSFCERGTEYTRQVKLG